MAAFHVGENPCVVKLSWKETLTIPHCAFVIVTGIQLKLLPVIHVEAKAAEQRKPVPLSITRFASTALANTMRF